MTKKPANPNSGKWCYRPAKSPIWRYRFTIFGQPKEGSTGETSKTAAEAYARKERDRLERLGEAANTPEHSGMTLGQAAEAYFKDKCMLQESDHAIKQDEKKIDRVVEWVGENVPVANIDIDVIASLIARRRKDHRREDPTKGLLKPTTVYGTTVEVMRRILSHAAKKKATVQTIDWSAFAVIKPIRKRQLSHQEEAIVEGCAREGYDDCFQMAVLSGLRKGNFTRLKWTEVDIPNREINTRSKKKDYNVQLTDRMIAILERQKGNDAEFVFTYIAQYTGKVARTTRAVIKGQRYPITEGGWASYLLTLKRRAGVDHFTTHDLRRTAGSRMTKTSGIKAASEFLNHSDIRITSLYYGHLDRADMRAAQEKMEAASSEARARFTAE